MTRKDIVKVFKRFIITFLCTFPFLLIVGYFLNEKINDALMVFMFVVIAGGVFFLEEVIHQKIKEKQKDK